MKIRLKNIGRAYKCLSIADEGRSPSGLPFSVHSYAHSEGRLSSPTSGRGE